MGKTRRVRLRLDVFVEFDRDLNSLPFSAEEVGEPVTNALCEVFEKVPGAIGLGWSRYRINLDERKT